MIIWSSFVVGSGKEGLSHCWTGSFWSFLKCFSKWVHDVGNWFVCKTSSNDEIKWNWRYRNVIIELLKEYPGNNQNWIKSKEIGKNNDNDNDNDKN